MSRANATRQRPTAPPLSHRAQAPPALSAYTRFSNDKRNSWLDDLQLRIQRGVEPPPPAGPSRSPSPFREDEEVVALREAWERREQEARAVEEERLREAEEQARLAEIEVEAEARRRAEAAAAAAADAQWREQDGLDGGVGQSGSRFAYDAAQNGLEEVLDPRFLHGAPATQDVLDSFGQYGLVAPNVVAAGPSVFNSAPPVQNGTLPASSSGMYPPLPSAPPALATAGMATTAQTQPFSDHELELAMDGVLGHDDLVDFAQHLEAFGNTGAGAADALVQPLDQYAPPQGEYGVYGEDVAYATPYAQEDVGQFVIADPYPGAAEYAPFEDEADTYEHDGSRHEDVEYQAEGSGERAYLPGSDLFDDEDEAHAAVDIDDEEEEEIEERDGDYPDEIVQSGEPSEDEDELASSGDEAPSVGGPWPVTSRKRTRELDNTSRDDSGSEAGSDGGGPSRHPAVRLRRSNSPSDEEESDSEDGSGSGTERDGRSASGTPRADAAPRSARLGRLAPSGTVEDEAEDGHEDEDEDYDDDERDPGEGPTRAAPRPTQHGRVADSMQAVAAGESLGGDEEEEEEEEDDDDDEEEEEEEEDDENDEAGDLPLAPSASRVARSSFQPYSPGHSQMARTPSWSNQQTNLGTSQAPISIDSDDEAEVDEDDDDDGIEIGEGGLDQQSEVDELGSDSEEDEGSSDDEEGEEHAEDAEVMEPEGGFAGQASDGPVIEDQERQAARSMTGSPRATAANSFDVSETADHPPRPVDTTMADDEPPGLVHDAAALTSAQTFADTPLLQTQWLEVETPGGINTATTERMHFIDEADLPGLIDPALRALLPDIIQTPGDERALFLSTPAEEVGPVLDTIAEVVEPVTAAAREEFVDVVAEVDADVAMSDDDESGHMEHQLDPAVAPHAVPVQDALHSVVDEAHRPAMSLPTAEEEDAQLRAMAGEDTRASPLVDVDDGVLASEEAQTEMVDEPDAVVVQHAPHVDDALHAAVSERTRPALSMPTEEEEEAQLLEMAGEDTRASPVAQLDRDVSAARYYRQDAGSDEVGQTPGSDPKQSTVDQGMEIDMPPSAASLEADDISALGSRSPAMLVETPAPAQASSAAVEIAVLPDPAAAPPDTDAVAVLEAGDAPITARTDRSPSIEAQGPAHTPTLVDSRPPSRAESEQDLPSPTAPPPDTDMPTVLEAGDIAAVPRAERSPSILVQAPAHTPTLDESRPPSRADSEVSFPDPSEAPRDATVVAPLEAGDMPRIVRSPSMQVEAPAHTPTLADSRPPSREESPALLPDPRAAPPDAHIPSPLDVHALLPREVTPTPSIVVQPPQDTPGVHEADGEGSMYAHEPEPTDGAHAGEAAEDVSEDVVHEAEPVVRDFATPLTGAETREQEHLAVPETETDAPMETPASERDVELAMPVREATPDAPLRHHHAPAHASPGRARRSVSPVGDGPSTRSHCAYRKLRVTDEGETQSAVVLAPHCVLEDEQRLVDEGVEDLGEPTMDEERYASGRPVTHGTRAVGSELLARLHRIAGTGVFDEGLLFLLDVQSAEGSGEGGGDEAGDGGTGGGDEGGDGIEIDISETPAGHTRSHSSAPEDVAGAEGSSAPGGSLKDAAQADDEEEQQRLQDAPAARTRSKTESVEPAAVEDDAPAAHTRSKTASVEPLTVASPRRSTRHKRSVSIATQEDEAGEDPLAPADVPAGNTRAQSARRPMSVEPDAAATALAEAGKPDPEDTPAGSQTSTPRRARRSLRLSASASVEPAPTHTAEEAAPEAESQPQLRRSHRRSASAMSTDALRVDSAAAGSGTAVAARSRGMRRSASNMSQSAIAEESDAAANDEGDAAPSQPRRSTRSRKNEDDHAYRPQSQSRTASPVPVKTAEESAVPAPRTPAKPQSRGKGRATPRRAAASKKRDEAPYRPESPGAGDGHEDGDDNEHEHEHESEVEDDAEGEARLASPSPSPAAPRGTRARRGKPKSLSKTPSRAVPVVEVALRSPTMAKAASRRGASEVGPEVEGEGEGEIEDKDRDEVEAGPSTPAAKGTRKRKFRLSVAAGAGAAGEQPEDEHDEEDEPAHLTRSAKRRAVAGSQPSGAEGKTPSRVTRGQAAKGQDEDGVDSRTEGKKGEGEEAPAPAPAPASAPAKPRKGGFRRFLGF